MLIQWSTKVDALKLYMAQLEDKIRVEQEAREKLAITYEESLNVGVHRLQDETQLLTESPLVREISLIVAKELVKKGTNDPRVAELIRQGSRDQTLLDKVWPPTE